MSGMQPSDRDTDCFKKFRELIQTFDMVISTPLTFRVCGAGRQSCRRIFK